MLSDEIKKEISGLNKDGWIKYINSLIPQIEAQEELIKEMLEQIESINSFIKEKGKRCIQLDDIIQKAKELLK